MTHLDDIVPSYPCGNCGKQFGKTFGWMKAHDHLVCDCGTRNEWLPDDIIEGLRRVAKERDEVIAKIRRANKG